MIRTLLLEAASWGAKWGLLLFLALFAATLAWVFRPGAKREYDRSAAIPLDDGTGRMGRPPKSDPDKGA
jgi:cbb3-type cytochrome oxidase subunit 3